MTTEKPTPYSGLFKRLLAPFQAANPAQDTDDGPAVQEAYDSVTQLKTLVAEMSRLRGLRDSETAKESELDAEFQAIELQRIEALTESKVSGDPEAKKRADSLLKKSGTVSQQKNDCRVVAASIKARIDALEANKKNLRHAYDRDLGVFLDRVFARMCEHYSALAPDVAEAALQIAAVQSVMMRNRCGNTNGFDRRIYLPNVDAGNGKSLTPILDADTNNFSLAVNTRMEFVIHELKQAGFDFRFD